MSACEHPAEVQQSFILRWIQKNALTAFGREHGFSAIRSIADYRRAVPVRNYEQYSAWTERSAAGESNVLTEEAPNLWLRTSATTGAPKKIPHTAYWRENHRGPAIYAQWANYLQYHSYLAAHPHATLDLSWERDVAHDWLGHGVPYQAITHRSASLGPKDWTPPWYDAPWFTFGEDTATYASRMYLRLRHFVGRDLRVLVAVNPSTPLAFANHLERCAPQLVADIRDGTMLGKPFGSPDRELARKLDQLLSRKGELRPADVWPNLNLVVGWKSASASLYVDQLHEVFPHAEVLPFSTTGTEGVVTMPVDRHPTAGLLAVTQGYFEFLPEGEHGEAGQEALGMDELSVGKDYLLVMTQANGLYRYAVGDVYRVLEFVGKVPRLEFVSRDGVFSSFTGEKLTEVQVTEAAKNALQNVGIRATRFTCCPTWGAPPYYTLVVEPKDAISEQTRARLDREFDVQLGLANDEYGSKRASNRLGEAVSKLVAPSTFQKYWDERVANGSSAVQLKHRWLQKDDAIVAPLLRLSGFADTRSAAG